MTLKYKPDTISYDMLKKTAAIPKFQRGLVWSPNAKREFIKTLSEGYPFGSLLLYRYQNEEKNSIIDGLQRFTTIRDFEENPGEYWSSEDKKGEKQEWLSLFENYQRLDAENGIVKPIDLKKLDDAFEGMVSFKYDQATVVAVIGDENYALLTPERTTEVLSFVTNLQEKVRNYIDLKELQIPVIEFKGDINELATVFENLNKSGTSLSKFQVFQAAWNSDIVNIPQGDLGNQIINYIVQRYKNLAESTNIEFDNNWDPSNITESREVTLSEFAYGIGALMYTVLDGLIGSKGISDSESTINNLGFSMLGIVAKVPNNKLTMLNDSNKFQSISRNVQKIITGVNVVAKQVKEQLAPILKKPVMQDERAEYELGLTTEFKLLSYFAAVWTASYKLSKVTDDDKETYEILDLNSKEERDVLSNTLKNIKVYYLNDYFNNLWRSSGDSRLSGYYLNGSEQEVPERTYNIPITKERFLDNFTNWNKEYSSTGSINIQREIKAIITIWSNLSSEIKFEPAKNYDFEHVFPKGYVQTLYKVTSFPAGALGNVMYLDSSINKKKQKKTLYEVASFKGLDEIRQSVFYPKKGDFVNFNEELNSQQIDLSETASVIFQRGQRIGEKIATDLGLN